MNYLAHAYLSFGQPEILVGNMISDFVKGKKKFDFSNGVQKGIALHRAIDTFTDAHSATKEAKEFLKPAAGLYSGAFIDVAYDHFLANDASQFTDESLKEMAAGTYEILHAYKEVLPMRFHLMLPYMTSHNWLYNYKNLRGAQNSFNGLARRAKYLSTGKAVFELFKEHYSSLQKCYINFFPSVKEFAEGFLKHS